MANLQVAKTIHQQMYTLDKNAMFCMGVHEFIGGKNFLQFKASGSNVKRGGRVRVTLNAADLYGVEVFRVIKGMKHTIKELHNVYAEDLVYDLFEIIG